MKKASIFMVFLCLIIVLAVTSGCKTAEKAAPQKDASDVSTGEDTSPLRVLIDVEYGSNIYRFREGLENYDKENVRGEWKGVSLKDKLEDMGGPSSIEIEIAPVRENERDIFLTSLRTEMMSGGGPDVFVCRCGTGYHLMEKGNELDYNAGYIESQPLFKYPQQAMKRNMFLPLDSFIEKAQFMEWDKLTPVVMDAGRTEKGQFLLPMTYTVPAVAFRRSDVEHTPSKDMKWEDMLLEGPHISLAAVGGIDYIGNALAPFADYEHDKLAISEKEMVRYLNAKLDDLKKYKEESGGVPCTLFPLQVLSEFDLSRYDEGFDKDDPIVLVPLYSRNGGYMATVTSFAGINVNTKKPDEAFWVVDYLLGEECQRSVLYANMTFAQAVPTLEGLMTNGKAVSDGSDEASGKPKAKMPDDFYEQFCAVRDNISFADFETPLDREFQKLYLDLREPSNKSRESMIHDAYMRMSMELAES